MTMTFASVAFIQQAEYCPRCGTELVQEHMKREDGDHFWMECGYCEWESVHNICVTTFSCTLQDGTLWVFCGGKA
jgi:ribosomal protein S27AE